MLADTLAIEFSSYAGELDFTVERLIRDAQQRAKGTRKRNPLAAIAADSISSAIARDIVTPR